jgi:hypothetical protein
VTGTRAPHAPARQRRSLSHVGGAIETAGEASAAKLLAHALDVAPAPAPDARSSGEDGPDRVHVHGFHAYPARMHPETASRLVRAFSPSSGSATVLDPFAGSGTVLVEAMLAGRQAVGTDLNPLAVRLAILKTEPHDAGGLERLIASAREVSRVADERRTARAGATRRYGADDVALFDPHILLELDGLRAGIAQVKDASVKSTLQLVLSAILVKVSKKQGDTSEHTAPRRLAAGYPARLFTRKTEELASRLSAFERALPSPRPTARVALDDATRLTTVANGSIDAVVTSPPYVATYDYVAHHAARMRWLDLDARGFERGEMGARRRFASLGPAEARQAWCRELGGLLRAMARVLRPRAPLVLLMADSAVGSTALRADELVAEVAPGARLRPVARASQRRPHFHGPSAAAFGRVPRAEHALLLERG